MRALAAIALWLALALPATAQTYLGQAPGPGYTVITTSRNTWVWDLPGGGGSIINMMPAFTYLCNPTNMNNKPAQACTAYAVAPPLFLNTSTNTLSLTESTPTLDTFVGHGVGQNAPTVGGGTNTGMGSFALNVMNGGSGNAAYGYSALNGLTTGSGNVGIGVNAGAILTTGIGNVAVGQNALVAATVANNNVAIGAAALANATGSGNLGIGQAALDNLIGGNNNIGIGIGAGNGTPGIVAGSNNTVVGACQYSADLSATVALCDGTGVVRFDWGKTAAATTTIAGPVASTTTLQAKTVYKASGPALPTCNAGAEGTWAATSDAPSTTFNAAYAPGGGANHMPVYCNGTAWTIH